MAEVQAAHPVHREAGEPSNWESVSLRSRASSVISTGTKLSISTMPQGTFHVDGLPESPRVSNRTATRPASIHSNRSVAPSLPPYEDLRMQSATGESQLLPPTPTATDHENALTMHYGRVVRTIDENHARQLSRIYQVQEQQLQAHAQELAATRNAVDQAYRAELRSKEREVERIREVAAASVAAANEAKQREVDDVRTENAATVASLESQLRSLSLMKDETMVRVQLDCEDRILKLHEEHQAAIDKARNAIEDLWEGRWHDRTRLAVEEANRHHLESQGELQRAVVDRDEEWLETLRHRHPELVDSMKAAIFQKKE